jgi:hypothetical protein
MKSVTKQFKKIPAIDEESDLLPAPPFSRGDALEEIGAPS